jgi:hypothetical protein
MLRPPSGPKNMERHAIFPFRIKQPEKESNGICGTPTGKTKPGPDNFLFFFLFLPIISSTKGKKCLFFIGSLFGNLNRTIL